MGKYQLLQLYGLRELLKTNKIYSPAGNRMIVVNNGFMGGQLFYSHKDGKVYGLCLKEIPITEKDKEWLDGEYAQSEVRNNMNYKEAIEFLKAKGKWNPPPDPTQED